MQPIGEFQPSWGWKSMGWGSGLLIGSDQTVNSGAISLGVLKSN